MTRIERAFDALLIKSKGEINSRIEKVSFEVGLENTKAKCYCYCLKSNANGDLRLKDLIEFIDERIVDYAIPKRDIDEASKYKEETGSSAKFFKLRKKATELFTDLEKTGEGGEILLYILVQEILGIPQLISKMSLKTSGQVHYQGADGIHVQYDPLTESLNLFWGEAKMYQKINSAITECFKSLNGYLLDTYSYKSTQERDLDLITANINVNVNDTELENLLVRYFDKDDEFSNKLVYKGICFIGYDCDKYPTDNLPKTLDEVKRDVESELLIHYKTLSEKIKIYPKLDTKEIHIFLMPFPSVKDFRTNYLQTIL